MSTKKVVAHAPNKSVAAQAHKAKKSTTQAPKKVPTQAKPEDEYDWAKHFDELADDVSDQLYTFLADTYDELVKSKQVITKQVLDKYIEDFAKDFIPPLLDYVEGFIVCEFELPTQIDEVEQAEPEQK